METWIEKLQKTEPLTPDLVALWFGLCVWGRNKVEQFDVYILGLIELDEEGSPIGVENQVMIQKIVIRSLQF